MYRVNVHNILRHMVGVFKGDQTVDIFCILESCQETRKATGVIKRLDSNGY